MATAPLTPRAYTPHAPGVQWTPQGLVRPGSTLVLDVSAVQPPTFDFAMAHAIGVRGVIVKASQGQGSPDHLFATHMRRAAEAVEMLTSYHVIEAHWDDMAVQAEEYFRIAHDSSMLCPIVDVERTDNSAAVPLERVAIQTAAFVAASSKLWARVGKSRGLLYASTSYLADMCATPAGLAALQSVRAAGWRVWLAAYRATDPTSAEAKPFLPEEVAGWQYTGGEMEFDGVGVDLSWFNGNERAIAALGDASWQA